MDSAQRTTLLLAVLTGGTDGTDLTVGMHGLHGEVLYTEYGLSVIHGAHGEDLHSTAAGAGEVATPLQSVAEEPTTVLQFGEGVTLTIQ